MTVAQVYITTDSGKNWIPWDGTATAMTFDTIAHSDPGPGERASIALDPVPDSAYVITGIFGSVAGVDKQARMLLQLFSASERKWSSHFMLVEPVANLSLTGLNIRLPREEGVTLEWLSAPEPNNFCTVGLTYHLVEA